MKMSNIVKTTTTTAISALPWVGGPLANLINEVLNNSWQERRETFEKEFKSKFEKLDSQFEEKIRESENFASIFASVSREALCDVEGDKVHLYANAMINTIKKESFSNTKIHIFLNILSTLTVAHIDLLKRLSTTVYRKDYDHIQRKVTFRQPTAKEKTIEEYFSDFDQKQIIQILLDNLYQNGLITSNSFLNGNNIAMALGGNTQLEKKTTDLGDEFLDFISEHE